MIMAILQSIKGIIFPVLTLVGYSYLPEIAREVVGETTTRYSAACTCSMIMFGSQIIYKFSMIGPRSVYATR